MDDEIDRMAPPADEPSALRRGLAACRGRGLAALARMGAPPARNWPGMRTFELQVARSLREQLHADGLLAVMVIDLGDEVDLEPSGRTGQDLAPDSRHRVGVLRLRRALRHDDSVGSSGSRELACAIPWLRSVSDAHAVCLRVAQHLDAFGGDSRFASMLRLQIGVALFPVHGATVGALLRVARNAQWQARNRPFGLAFAPGNPPGLDPRCQGLAGGTGRL